MGLKYIYMDTGSEYNTAINNKLIQAVESNISVPLFIGWYYKSKSITTCWDAGADIVVIGNYIEKTFIKCTISIGTLASYQQPIDIITKICCLMIIQF